MPTKVVMAQLSPTMEEGRLIEWKFAEGDAVSQGDIVAEIETDKANMDVEALGGGVLRKIVVQAGATVPVGALIGVIAGPDEPIEGRFHVPPITETVIFDEALEPLTGDDVRGGLGFLDPYAACYPGFIITGDNVRRRAGGCPCGIGGMTITDIGRATGREVKGCGGIMAAMQG